jgi:hypothetical protein
MPQFSDTNFIEFIRFMREAKVVGLIPSILSEETF